MNSPGQPVVLTIAGSDSSAGAGIQADLKTFAALGTYGLTAVTAVIAEAPGCVEEVHSLPPLVVGSQLDCLGRSYPIAALKTGLLSTAAIIRELQTKLSSWSQPIVVDPVAIASTGTSLVDEGYQKALEAFIRERATLVTPNRLEAETLLGRSLEDPEFDAAQLSESLGCAVLLKGGHLDLEADTCTDYLALPGRVHPIVRQRLQVGDVHGTGCTYSAAITAHLALGASLLEAVERARDYLQQALEQAQDWEGPEGARVKALEHFPKTGHQ